MTDVENFEINVTVVNGQKMKCELKGSINTKLQYGENGETYLSPVRAPSCGKPFERINDHLEGRHDGGQSV